MKLAGCTSLLTGASGGLGTCVAHAFWEAGANLILVARSPQRLTELIARLPPRPSQRALALVADLNNPLAPERIVAEARQEFETVEVLVNNAAIQGPIGPFWENDWQEWQETIQVNLLAPIALCRVFVPWMVEHGGGKIINLSGGGGTSPRPNFSAYAVAKTGLIRFSETLADETRHLGIRVNCVAPGAMDSALSAIIVNTGPKNAGQREYDQALKVRAGSGARPERAAALCVFLASAQSEDITGKLISAVWDPWETLPSHLPDLQQTDVYTLRRIVPKDRGQSWGAR
jgi:3-oxoacyl-[acyl-carrier protein] reductase